ncbi:transposase [Streptomyces sp. NPDC007856]|uniref:transposase n=1 Tax=Streptomyces sp. NPDC007856 TaxID=3364781 RepID=UPI0036A124A0
MIPVHGQGDLTDEQWAVLERLLPKRRNVGLPPVRSRRQLIDGIRFRVRTGVPRRGVPVEYGPWGRRNHRVVSSTSPMITGQGVRAAGSRPSCTWLSSRVRSPCRSR